MKQKIQYFCKSWYKQKFWNYLRHQTSMSCFTCFELSHQKKLKSNFTPSYPSVSTRLKNQGEKKLKNLKIYVTKLLVIIRYANIDRVAKLFLVKWVYNNFFIEIEKSKITFGKKKKSKEILTKHRKNKRKQIWKIRPNIS